MFTSKECVQIHVGRACMECVCGGVCAHVGKVYAQEKNSSI